MHYKTIVLEVLEARPHLRAQLQKYRLMLPTLSYYARELQTSHQAWQARLATSSPPSDPVQLASEALEHALAELTSRLPSESTAADETFCLDEAIALVRNPSSGG